MIHFIVATHGPLAAALLESSRMVYGDLPCVHAVCLTEQAGIEGFRRDFSNVHFGSRAPRARQPRRGGGVVC